MIKKTLITLITILIASSIPVFADKVYITACTQPSGTGANTDGSYTEIVNVPAAPLSGTTAFSTAKGAPLRTASRFRAVSGFTNGLPFVRLSPTLGVPGGVYRVYYTHSSTALNSVTNTIIGFTNITNCTLSFTETPAFSRRFGLPAPQSWQTLGFLTNNPGMNTPIFEIYVKSTTDITTLRLLVDCFRFILDDPCLDVPDVDVTGPLGASSTTAVVTGVATNATKITVYQDSGAGMVEVGSKTSGIVGGIESVAVAGLVKGAKVAAAQTVGGQDGCVPDAGTFVGGGANPTVRLAFSIRETTGGTVGSSATNVASANIHFLGASATSGGAPINAKVISPSNQWQTFTLSRGNERAGNSSNVVGSITAGAGFAANSTVKIQVYAYRTVNNTVIYSEIGADSSIVTSNDVFSVDWTWAAVSGAEGYRILRDINSNGWGEALDVPVNSYADNGSPWGFNVDTSQKTFQTDSSIVWNGVPAAGTNVLTNQWGIIESINFAIDDPSDTGPFDLYIDNIQNGSTVFQTFENAVAGATDYGFRSPTFSGTTSASILPAPNISVVTNSVADSGSKSLRVSFQWNATNSLQKWLRLTTSGAFGGTSNPVVNLDNPISIRLLMLPVGTPLPAAPAAPFSLAVNQQGSAVVLDWTGTHRLQASTDVAGVYTNVLVTTNQWNPSPSPYTNQFPESQKFFRLKD